MDQQRVASIEGMVLEDRYVIQRALDAGGMARVYLATQKPFGRQVAIKVLKNEHAEDTNLISRFMQEAHTISRLAHPNTVKVYDFGRTDAEELYIVMEYVEGKPLGKYLKERGGTLELDEAITYAIQIAQALGEAHYKGIIHRDLKPDNIMIVSGPGTDPYVKVLDFGIAKIMGQDRGWTEVGSIVGTPYYMAPEQARQGPIDGRVDIYSLGCCLYEMLVGEPPFPGDTVVKVLMAHQEEAPPHLPEDFPAPLNEFVQRALHKKSSNRPADAATFIAELMGSMMPEPTQESLPARSSGGFVHSGSSASLSTPNAAPRRSADGSKKSTMAPLLGSGPRSRAQRTGDKERQTKKYRSGNGVLKEAKNTSDRQNDKDPALRLTALSPPGVRPSPQEEADAALNEGLEQEKLLRDSAPSWDVPSSSEDSSPPQLSGEDTRAVGAERTDPDLPKDYSVRDPDLSSPAPQEAPASVTSDDLRNSSPIPMPTELETGQGDAQPTASPTSSDTTSPNRTALAIGGALLVGFIATLAALAASASTSDVRKVVLETEPPGAVIRIDRVSVGRTPTEYEAPVGKALSVSFERDGFTSKTIPNVTVKESGQNKVFADLQPKVIDLSVNVPLQGATVEINGEPYGALKANNSRTFAVEWPSKSMRVVVRHPDYADYVQTYPQSRLKDQVTLEIPMSEFVSKAP